MIVVSKQSSFGSHAAGADLTYKWISGNTYEVTAAFYRDCGGIAQPSTVTLVYGSASCNFSSTQVLPLINNGPVITYPCNSVQTTCTGGSVPGIQQWLYRANVTLPFACTDWKLSYNVVARNCAITTIVQPSPCNSSTSYEPIYVEALLNNVDAPGNSSPTFSNVPISFVCLGQDFNYNHGVIDMNADSLSYSLITPLTSSSSTVTYLPGYSATAPIASSPSFSINSTTGDLFMHPTAIQVSVVAVKVNEYRNGVLIGSVIRDMQIYSRNCTPNLVPFATGINGTTDFTAYVCPGTNLCFNVNSGDPNPGQTVVMTWNSGIPAASFNISGSPYPTGQFCWTPQPSDARSQPYTFTVTVRDDACPLNGLQTYSFSIYVPDVDATVTSSDFNGFGVSCNGDSNGSLTATPTGGILPFSYSWNTVPIQTNDVATGLSAGTYEVTVTDSKGCSNTFSGTITEPSVVVANISSSSASTCGNANGSATVSGSGGAGFYTYLWSTGQTTASVTGITAGTYIATVTDVNGCSDQTSVTIANSGQASTTNVSASICQGGTYTLPDGSVVAIADTYTNTFVSLAGCDSVIITTLSVNTVITTQVPASFCNGDTYMLPDGIVVSTGGVYTSTLVSASNCDSVVVTTLTINPIYAFVENISICEGSSYVLPNGVSVSVDGSYISELLSLSGCDSVITSNVTVNPVITTQVSAAICDGDSYTLPDGSMVSTGGVYNTLLMSTGNCDSLVVTTLNVNAIYNSTEFVSICSGSSYTLPNGIIVSIGGSYLSELSTSAGCDSLITIELSINPVITEQVSSTICDGGSYTLPDGSVVWSGGVYNTLLVSATGCDSLVVTTLSINTVYSTSENVSICSGTSYTLPSGQAVTQPGSYFSTLTSVAGCDSVITTNVSFVSITIPVISANGSLTICEGTSITFTSTAAAYYQWIRNNVAISGANGQSYTTSKGGNYKVSVVTACGVKYSNKLVVTKNPKPVVSVSPSGTNTICANDSLLLSANVNGNITVNYQWYRNAVAISGATSSTFYAVNSGNYKVIVTNVVTGCFGMSAVTKVNKQSFTASITHDIPLVTCYDDITFTLTTSAGLGATYIWRMNGLPIPGATGLTHATKTPGKYNVLVTNANGCTRLSNSFTVIIDCDDKKKRIQNPITVQPNPTNGPVEVDVKYNAETTVSAELLDITGRMVMLVQENVVLNGDVKIKFDTSELNAGIYFVRIVENGQPRAVRLIVQQ